MANFHVQALLSLRPQRITLFQFENLMQHKHTLLGKGGSGDHSKCSQLVFSLSKSKNIGGSIMWICGFEAIKA